MILFRFIDVKTETRGKQFDFARVTELLRAELWQLRPLPKKSSEPSYPGNEGAAPNWKEFRNLGNMHVGNAGPFIETKFGCRIKAISLAAE